MDNNSGNWFEDDPEWAELRRRLDKQPASPERRESKLPDSKPQPVAIPKPVSPHKQTKISVNITIPEFKIPKVKLPKPLPRKLVWGGAAAMCALIAVIGLSAVNFRKSADNNKPDNKPAVLSEIPSKPDFKIILPEGKEEETESGKIGYDPQKKVVSFNDKIGVVHITVSQQPLPDSFKNDPEKQLETLAKNFSANEIVVPSNPKVYLGTSAKGPQTAIFYKNDLLVFIQSSSKIDKIDWTDYIRGLR